MKKLIWGVTLLSVIGLSGCSSAAASAKPTPKVNTVYGKYNAKKIKENLTSKINYHNVHMYSDDVLKDVIMTTRKGKVNAVLVKIIANAPSVDLGKRYIVKEYGKDYMQGDARFREYVSKTDLRYYSKSIKKSYDVRLQFGDDNIVTNVRIAENTK